MSNKEEGPFKRRPLLSPLLPFEENHSTGVILDSQKTTTPLIIGLQKSRTERSVIVETEWSVTILFTPDSQESPSVHSISEVECSYPNGLLLRRVENPHEQVCPSTPFLLFTLTSRGDLSVGTFSSTHNRRSQTSLQK